MLDLLPAARTVVFFAAHPDDETIGAGGRLPFLPNAWIVHATDGAPHNMSDARAHGFTTREQYAAARRSELLAALGLAGVPPERALTLGFADQECPRQLTQLIMRIVPLLRELRPAVVLAPPYEGGHPDHDSLAFAISMACRILARERHRVPEIVEHALYHGQSGRLQAGEFLPRVQDGAVTVALADRIAELKRRMLGCFVTQRTTLAQFPTAHESFRPAPVYDFYAPPHSGSLYYEKFPWGVTGEQWRRLAEDAARSLEVTLS